MTRGSSLQLLANGFDSTGDWVIAECDSSRALGTCLSCGQKRRGLAFGCARRGGGGVRVVHVSVWIGEDDKRETRRCLQRDKLNRVNESQQVTSE
jgi:hypothetical protein